MNRAVRSLGLLLAAALAASPTRATGAQAPFAECERLVREAPDREAGYLCLWRTARAARDWTAASGRLEAWRSTRPDNAWATLYLGACEADLGRPRGLALYHEALETFRRTGDLLGQTRAHEALAVWHEFTGRRDEALRHLARARELAAALGDPTEIVDAGVRTSWLLFRARLYDKAYLEAVRTRDAVDGAELAPRTRLALVEALAATSWGIGREGDAFRLYDSGVELAERQADARQAAHLALQKAIASPGVFARLTPRHLDRVRDLLEEAAARARRAEHALVEARALVLLAELDGATDRALERLGRAEALYRRWPALRRELIDVEQRRVQALSLRGEITWEEARSRLRQLEAEASALEAGRLLDSLALARFNAARRLAAPEVAIAEGERTVARLERLRGAQLAPTVREALLVRTSWAYALYAGYLLARHLESGDPALVERAFVVNEMLHARVLVENRDETTPRPAGSSSERTFASISDVRSRLRLGEALVAWLLDQDTPTGRWEDASGGWAIVVTRDAARVVALPRVRGPELPWRIRALNALLARGDAAARDGLARMHRELVEPVLSVLPQEVDTLLLIPGSELLELPFQALSAGEDDPPLGVRYAVSYPVSASLWLSLAGAEADHARSPQILSIADPQIDLDAEPARLRTAAVRDAAVLGPLPWARREARDLVRILGVEGRILIGDGATEAALKRVERGTYRLIHVAAHALVETTDPRRSAILLAAGAQGEDGVLTYDEVRTLPLEGTVVLLAACDSASGAPTTGEGLVGLSHAMLLAGARAVVGSRWPVRDEQTSRFMADLARGLARGLDVAGALREARGRAVEAGRPAADWSGLIVVGDGGFRPFPEGTPGTRRWSGRAWAAAVALALALAAGAAAALRVRSRRSIR
ncbi:MAG: hypothetical protein Kow0062_07620 [Acidobacteriota bacterium]